MKISLNWLKEYIDLSGISFGEIESNLTMCGLEVESFENQQQIYANFFVAKVVEVVRHPNADKLSLCKVFDGKDTIQIVCGAPNVAANQKVVLGKIGAVIPQNNLKLTKAKIRGVESFGMLCSGAELLISNDHSGILVLRENLAVGTPITDAFGLNDIIFEIGITPNRPDALSHIGVARDLAAIFNKKLNLPPFPDSIDSQNAKSIFNIRVDNPSLCPRYSAKIVKNVTVHDSPDWLKDKLKAVGLRPINNIVDITNFILMELGQPLHAFDLANLAGNQIIVKTAGAISSFTTLDSKERKISPDTLLICDAEKPVAIAGIMGGENSEVTTDTKDILIESAYFNPSSVRKSSKLLGLSTDSSYRFERGCNPEITLHAAERAAELIASISGGVVIEGCIDIYPQKISEPLITLRFDQIMRILGYTIEKDKIKNILTSLGFAVSSETESDMIVHAPLFRPDCEREIDLIEEIARIYGYNYIPPVERIAISLEKKNDDSAFSAKLKNIFVGLGFNEAYANTLLSERTAKLFGNPIKMLNPQSIDLSFLRTSLIPGAIEMAAKNINVSEKNLRIFEIGSVFNAVKSEITSFNDFTEDQKAMFLVTGDSNPEEWFAKPRKFEFFDIKSYLNLIVSNFLLDNFISYSYYSNRNNLFDLSCDLAFHKDGKNTQIGFGGSISKSVLKEYGINQEVYCFEFSVSQMKAIQTPLPKFKDLLRFPKIQKDFAFIFDSSITFDEIKNFIIKNSSELLKEVSLFDLYQHETIGAGKRSLAFNLVYYDFNRTLTDEEIDTDFFGLIEKIKNNFKAVLRGN
ncbi:MAG: phenylalanine--tRNA ligase subunit beta [Ignavibacteriaceae bacterium]